MIEFSSRAAAVLLAILGPAALLSLKYAFRRITNLGKETVVVITGASSGIGKACAKEFYRLGCQVVLSSSTLRKLEDVKEELLTMEDCGNCNEPFIALLDISDGKSIAKAAEEIAKKFPNGIHVLINNAGISYRGEISSTSMEVYRNVMETNFFGHVAFTKAMLPSMQILPLEKGNPKAHIVSINSMQGKFSIPHRSAYSASKFASEAFFDCLRSELADSGIRVCSVYPAYVRTNISMNAIRGDGSKHGKMDETTESGMDASYVAAKIVEAVRFNKEEVVLTDLKPRAAYWLRFFLPFLYFWIMKRRAIKKKLD